jgi:hypothetical protein
LNPAYASIQAWCYWDLFGSGLLSVQINSAGNEVHS